MTEWTVRLAAQPAPAHGDDGVGRLARAISEGRFPGQVDVRDVDGTVQVLLVVDAPTAADAAAVAQAELARVLPVAGVRPAVAGPAEWLVVVPGLPLSRLGVELALLEPERVDGIAFYGVAGALDEDDLDDDDAFDGDDGWEIAETATGPHPARAGELAGTVALDRVLAVSADVVLALEGGRAFVDCWECRLVAARREDAPWDPAWLDAFGPDGIRLELGYADGTVVRIGEGPTGPGGASMTATWLEAELALGPLPPAGPVRVTAAWGALGVPETTCELDGDAIRAAAARARRLLP